MAHEGHDHHHHPHDDAASVTTVSTSVICVGNQANELLVSTVARLLENAGHQVVDRAQVKTAPSALLKALEQAQASGARAVIVLGGTSLGRSDGTIETLQGALLKTLPGFGELLRGIIAKDRGVHALGIRAIAGTMPGMLVFALPAELDLASRAVNHLILPELGNLVQQLFQP